MAVPQLLLLFFFLSISIAPAASRAQTLSGPLPQAPIMPTTDPENDEPRKAPSGSAPSGPLPLNVIPIAGRGCLAGLIEKGFVLATAEALSPSSTQLGDIGSGAESAVT